MYQCIPLHKHYDKSFNSVRPVEVLYIIEFGRRHWKYQYVIYFCIMNFKTNVNIIQWNILHFIIILIVLFFIFDRYQSSNDKRKI